MPKQFILCGVCILFLYSCASRPVAEDIKRKIVIDYPCPETVEVSALQITGVKETVSFIGGKGFEYTVSGEVVWKDGCDEFTHSLKSGDKEKFENKIVILIKGEEGWR